MRRKDSKMVRLNPYVRLTKLKLKAKAASISQPVRPILRRLHLRNRELDIAETIKRVKVEKKEPVDRSVSRQIPELKPDDDNLQCVFKENELIFAKTFSYAPWPGRIIRVVQKAPSKPKKKLTAKQYIKKFNYRVLFYGSNDEYTVTGDCIYFYTLENIQLFRNNKYKSSSITDLFRKGMADSERDFFKKSV